LVARWSYEFGFISIHDPTSGEWYDLPTKATPSWAKNECFLRRELRKERGITRLLNQREIEEVWREKQAEMWEEHAPPAALPPGRKPGLRYDEEEEDG